MLKPYNLSMNPQEIKSLRECLGDSQRDFGRRVGLAHSYPEGTVSKWERGTQPPNGGHDLALRGLRILTDSKMAPGSKHVRMMELFNLVPNP